MVSIPIHHELEWFCYICSCNFYDYCFMKNQNQFENQILLLNQSVNNLIVELCLTTAKCEVLEQAFLDILKDLEPSVFKERYQAYIDFLEKEQTNRLNDISGILLETGDHGFHSRAAFQLFQHFSSLKKSDDYKDS